jgi:hypothetical protein
MKNTQKPFRNNVKAVLTWETFQDEVQEIQVEEKRVNVFVPQALVQRHWRR